MFFTVASAGAVQGKSQAILVEDDWNDWFEFETLYTLIVFDADGQRHVIGGVKIGQFEMQKPAKGASRPALPKKFNKLDERFFSLGQDASYYQALNNLPEFRDKVLLALRDVALDPDLFETALEERVTGVSLLRSVARSTVTNQFNRLAKGGALLSEYRFTFVGPALTNSDPVRLSFVVEPQSQPPTNVHVLVGRNGVGKTHTLHYMARAAAGEGSDVAVGSFVDDADELELGESVFANIVSVSFSAFDLFEPLPVRKDKAKGTQYCYIGLKRRRSNDDEKVPPKTPEDLSSEFAASAWICRQLARRERWYNALVMLESDPIFKDAEVTKLASEPLAQDQPLPESDPAKVFRSSARKLFKTLSSGHKIVLLTVTALIENVEERTLVLIDEPEAHLHPPLLSAFLRALSELLMNRNGVALIATHSPVVLQEVPRRCVWKIRRHGTQVVAERPEIETFGENTGVLTREVFGLEVTSSGFHKMLRDASAKADDYEALIKKFGGELGGEAKALARVLLAESSDADKSA